MHQLADFERNDQFQLGVIRSFRYSDSANQLVDKLAAANRVSQAGGLEPLYQALILPAHPGHDHGALRLPCTR